MWVACSHQGSYSLKLHNFSEQKLPERNESHLLLGLLGLFVSLNINFYNIHPNLQLYCQNWVYKVIQVLSWGCNQGAHLSGSGRIPCHPVEEGRATCMSNCSRKARLKVRTSCLYGQLLICQTRTAPLPSSGSLPLLYPVPTPGLETSYFRSHSLSHSNW